MHLKIQFRTVLLLCGLLHCYFLNAQAEFSEAQLKTVLRSIGHKTLLQVGDSTSRVLPVEKNDNSYLLRFDSSFSFVPDSIIELFRAEAVRSELPKHFVVEAIACSSEAVVHSFVIKPEQESDIVSCKLRELPYDCYQLKVSFPDHAITDLENINPSEENENETDYLFIGISVLVLLILLMLWNKSRKTRKAKKNAHLINIGQIQFDSRNTELLINDQRFELTAKEAELLMLLYKAANTTVEREVILNRVWGDEGDYVGRTLDVFISKLRKKLEADSKVKIVNIRGVGYKMVVNS